MGSSSTRCEGKAPRENPDRPETTPEARWRRTVRKTFHVDRQLNYNSKRCENSVFLYELVDILLCATTSFGKVTYPSIGPSGSGTNGSEVPSRLRLRQVSFMESRSSSSSGTGIPKNREQARTLSPYRCHHTPARMKTHRRLNPIPPAVSRSETYDKAISEKSHTFRKTTVNPNPSAIISPPVRNPG